MRNGYLDLARPGGNTALLAGLISGRTHAWIGSYGIIFSPGNTTGGTSPFLRDTSNSSFFGTYCAHSSCTAELNDPVYDGTYMAFGVWAAGTGQQASAIGQGAQLYQSDRTPPAVAHVAVSDPIRWYRSGAFTSRVAAADNGMGMDRMGVTFARPAPAQPYFDAIDLPCQGTSTSPCPRTIPATSFTYDTGLMPEGRNTVNGAGIDIIGRTTLEPMRASADTGAPLASVKVDRTPPTLVETGGTLAARNGRAVVDGVYTATLRVRDTLSGVELLGHAIDNGDPVTQPALPCPERDCPQEPAAHEIEIDTSQLTAGEHTVSVYAKDSAGNDLRQIALRFVVDHAPPSITTLDHAPPLAGWIGARTLTAEATAPDDASGVQRFSLTTPTSGGATTVTDVVVAGCDDTIANLCPLSATRSIDYATGSMGDGPARPVSLVAADALGQESAPRAWTVDVDTAGPQVALSGPAWDARDGFVGASGLPLAVAAVDSVGGERRSGVGRIELRVDGELVAEREHDPEDPCVTTGSEPCDLDASFTLDPAGLESGEHAVTVTATDQAAPANATTRSFTVRVDRQAPAITTVTHDPAPPEAWRDDVPRGVTLSAHDELSGVERFTLTVPGIGMPQVQSVMCAGPPAAPCPHDASATFSYATSGLPEGASSSSATVFDAADNAPSAREWTVRVDRTPPAVAYSGSLTQLGGQVLIGGSADLRIDASDGHSGVRRIRVLVDGQEKLRRDGTCATDGCPQALSDTIVIAANDYPAGTHTVRVEVSDLVGAPAARHVAVRELTFVNVSAPVTDETSPQGTLGFEDWQSYDDHPTGAGSAAHVNLTSGNALWSRTFLDNPGRGIDSIGRLTYNSQEPGLLKAIPLLNGLPLVSGLVSSDYNQVGRGFSLQISGVTRLNQPLEFVGGWLLNPTPTSVRLVDGDGTRHTFTQVTSGQRIYQGPPGTNLRLRAFDGSGPRQWAMTRPDGVTYFFDGEGYITQIADRVGNVMAFEYQTVPVTERPYTQCGRPSALLVVGCPKRVVRITDAAGVAQGAPDRSVHVAYVPASLSQPGTGMIESISDHAGRVTRFGYDSQRRLRTVTEAAGTPVQRSFSLNYDTSSSGYLHTVTDPRGSTSKIAYEPQGLLETSLRRMTGFADRATRGTTYAYARTTLDGATVNSTAITDPKGRVTQVRTDARQRTVEVVDARGKRDRSFWNDAVNKRSRYIEARGTADEAITKWEWGSLGQLRRAFEPFKAAGESSARFTDFDYQLSRGTFPGSDQALVVYDLTELVAPKGAAGPAERARFRTTWAVDGLGRVTSMCAPKQACHGYMYVPGTGGVGGLVETVTDPMGNVVRYAAHDPSGLAREVTDERGKKWSLDYDGVGNLLAVRDPRGAGDATPITAPTDRPYTARYGYDRLNRKVSETIPKQSALGRFVRRSFEYDANDNRRIVTDGTNAVWRTEYTVTDQPQVEVSPAVEHDGEDDPASEETFFEYDATDQISVVRRPQGRAESANGFLTRYAYDGVDQMIVERRVSDESTPAGGFHQLVTSWAYDLRGNRTGVADPNANVEVDDQTAAANAADPARQRFAYGYDVADRRDREVEDPDDLALTTTSTYDVHDNLRTVTSPRGHDPDEPNPGNFTTTYDYDDQDLRIGATDPLGRHTEWKRRKDGRVTEITSPRGTVTADPNDFVTKLEYDAAGDLRRRTLPRAPNQYGPDVMAVTYARDDVGDPVEVTDARGHTFTNAFLDTGQLRGTDRPSWWIYDGEQGTVRERTDQDPRPSAAGRELPGEQGHGDFGKTEPQDLPDLLPRRGQAMLGYDDELRLTSVTDVTGIRQELGHDAVGRMTSRTIPYKGTAPDESRTSCAPGVEGGEPTTGAIQITWRYDRNGNRRSMRDGRCHETTWAYDQFDRLLTTTAPAGWGDSRAVTTLSLDRNGNTLKRALPRDPEHAFERMTYDAADRMESFVEPFDADAPRSQWRYRYDANGNRVREIRPRSLDPGVVDVASFTTRMVYDEADQLQSSTDGAGHVTELDYDRDGNQVEVRASGAARASGAGVASRVTRRTFDGRGLLWAETTGSGSDARTTVTEYDANGNLRRVVDPLGVGAGGLPEHADIGPDAAMSTATMANWHATVNEYTEDDLLRARYLPKDGADGEDRWKQTTTYTEQGWPLEVSEVFRWTGANSAQVRTRYSHLSTGWVSEVVDKDGSPDPQRLIYDYDLAGNQTLWASPGRTRRVEREFFPDGELQQRRAIRTRRDGQPVTGETRTYDYVRNPAGELTALADRNAPRADPGQPATRVTTIARDVAGRITDVNESWDGGRDTRYRYRTGGLIADVRVDGRIVDGVYADGRRMSYEYDVLDRATEVRVRQFGEGAAQDRVTTTTFWPSGEQRELRKANGTVETRYFATDGRITSRTSRPEGASTTTHDYDYDPNGNRTTDERGTYEYNARDQLTHWDRAGAGSTENPDRQVTYRPAGDGRLLGTTETFSAPGAVSTTRTTQNTYEGERLVSASVLTTASDGGTVPDAHRQLRYDYDIFGALLTIKTAKTADADPPGSAFETTTQYTYDSFERLLSSRDDADDDGEADGDHEVYCHDALDRRDRRLTGIGSVDNTDPDSFEAQRTACLNPPDGSSALDYSYLGLGEQLTRENTSTGRGPRTYDYAPDGTRLGQRAKATSGSAAKFRPYETDAQGNVVAVEDPNQDENTPGDDDGDPAPEAGDRYQLDPYGETSNESQLSTVAKDNPFRYQGHYLDPASGTYDMQARAYRPALGRFLTQDRFEDPSVDLTLQQDPLTNNRYAFLAGNPTNGLEWDGHRSQAVRKERLFANPQRACQRGVGAACAQLRGKGPKPFIPLYANPVSACAHGGPGACKQANITRPRARRTLAAVQQRSTWLTGSWCMRAECSAGQRQQAASTFYVATLRNEAPENYAPSLPWNDKGDMDVPWYDPFELATGLVGGGLASLVKGTGKAGIARLTGAAGAASTSTTASRLAVLRGILANETGSISFSGAAGAGVRGQGALSARIAATFKGGRYTTRTLDGDLILYRRWGGEAGELGPYWSRTNYARAGNARRYSALPPGNTAENVATIRVPAGTTIHEGRAAAHAEWGAPGGGSQVVFDEGFRVPREWAQP